MVSCYVYTGPEKGNMEDKYYRLVTFIVDICPIPLRELFLTLANQGLQLFDLDTFLQSKKQTISRNKYLRRADTRKLLFPLSKGCADVNEWDVVLISNLLKALFPNDLRGVKHELDEISNIRNEYLHISKIDQISDLRYRDAWKRLENATLHIVNNAFGQNQKRSTQLHGEILDRIEEAAKVNNVPIERDKLLLWYKEWTMEIKQQHEDRFNRLDQQFDKILQHNSNIKESINQSQEEITDTLKRRDLDTETETWISKAEERFSKTMANSKQLIPERKFVRTLKHQLHEKHRAILVTEEKLDYSTVFASLRKLYFMHKRCIEMSNPKDWPLIRKSTSLKLVVFKDPFGQERYDERKAGCMLEIMDDVLWSETNFDFVLVTDKHCLSDFKKNFDHGLLKDLVQPMKTLLFDVPGASGESEEEDVSCNEKERNTFTANLHGRDIFPSNKELIEMCVSEGRKSSVIGEICTKICEAIKSTSNHIKLVWTAYRFGEEYNIIFCVITDEKCGRVAFKNYSIVQREVDQYSTEERDVLQKEKTCLFSEQIKSQINDYAEQLMNEHRNLTMIAASSLHSSGFGLYNHKVVSDMCIVLYVQIKGLIPISEDAFPSEIGKYSTDVREGTFQFSGEKPDQFHKNVKMGCKIATAKYAGTLGGFIDLPKYGVCGLTCAHTIFKDKRLKEIGKMKNGTFTLDDPIACFQPDGSEKFGEVVKAIVKNGDKNKSGIDIAVIKIKDERRPLSGDFPDAPMCKWNDAGFKPPDEPMKFMSGEVLEKDNIEQNRVVVKFGMRTTITRSMLCVKGRVVRQTDFDDNSTYHLKNQIDVKSRKKTPFSKKGDSGSVVFSDTRRAGHNEITAIGILVGGTHEVKTFTPICEILRELRVKPVQLLSFTDHAANLEKKKVNKRPNTRRKPHSKSKRRKTERDSRKQGMSGSKSDTSTTLPSAEKEDEEKLQSLYKEAVLSTSSGVTTRQMKRTFIFGKRNTQHAE